jgi:DNA mismatch endonuclease (patch repair protein)
MPRKITVEPYVTSALRSKIMSKIRSKDTKPELIVRKVLRSQGYTYRLHSKKLPGKPDVYIPKIDTVVFVHGCFWHRHKRCKKFRMPKNNVEFWENKLTNNVLRFKKQRRLLKKANIKIVTVWECQTKSPEKLYELLHSKIGV